MYIIFMDINQALVVYKSIPNLKYRKERSRKRRIQQELSEHFATLDELDGILKSYGIRYRLCSVKRLKGIGKADLVITVGGDGTLLTTAHFALKQPILGINSFGAHSVGYFCAATRETMPGYIKSVIEGGRKLTKLNRLQVEIGKRKIPDLALNDVLFAHPSPAAASNYKIQINGRREEQKSSGVWISTAAGSTAAIQSAGGKTLPINSFKMNYLVREPYSHKRRYKILKGTIPPTASVKITSFARHGAVFLDGYTTSYPVPFESTVTIRNSKHPLSIFWRR